MASIKVSANKLKQACENFLKKRQDRIQRERDEIINSYVGKRKYKLFGPVFTYESAKEYLTNASSFDDYNTLEWKGGLWASKAEDMLALTKHGDPVTLTDGEIWIMEYL